MPGIVGLITDMPRERAIQDLTRMLDTVRHESFYAAGTWLDESLGVYVGWVVQKNSFAEGMPLHNESGDIVLVFSGEEYPEPGTARRLKERGHSLNAHGPSYLVHLCEDGPPVIADGERKALRFADQARFPGSDIDGVDPSQAIVRKTRDQIEGIHEDGRRTVSAQP